MHFGENQLSPLSIGISPLPTSHPSGLQSTPVRPSMSCYGHFSLTMGSSSGFGSTPCDLRPIETRFRCGCAYHSLNPTTEGHSSDHTPKGTPSAWVATKATPTPSTACKHRVSGSVSLPSPGCFSPFPHGTVRYRSLRVSSLGEWAPQLHTGFHVSGATQEPLRPTSACARPGCHGLWRRFPDVFGYLKEHQRGAAADAAWSYNPRVARPAGLTPHEFGHAPVRSPLLRG